MGWNLPTIAESPYSEGYNNWLSYNSSHSSSNSYFDNKYKNLYSTSSPEYASYNSMLGAMPGYSQYGLEDISRKSQTDWKTLTPSSSLTNELSGMNLASGAVDQNTAAQWAGQMLTNWGVSDLNNLKYTNYLGEDGSKQNAIYDTSTKKFLNGNILGYADAPGHDTSLYYDFVPNADGSVGLKSRTEVGTPFSWTDVLPVLGVAALPLMIAAMGGTAAAGAGATEAGTATAGTAAAAEGATGLASLPMAGTWAQTALPALGASAGEWTLPGALAGVEGATVAAGTLGGALGSAGYLGSTFGTSAGAPASSSLWSTLSDAYSTASKANNIYNLATKNNTSQQGQSNMPTNSILGLLGQLYGQGQYGSSLNDISKNLMSAGDPFGSQRAQYAQQLANTYSNPQQVYDSQYSALDKTFFNDLLAQDAAAGRSTDAYKRGVEREAAYNKWLTDYRTQLAGLAGANVNPSQVASSAALLQQAGAKQNNFENQNVYATLASLFSNPQQTYKEASNIYDSGKGLWDTISGWF